jgi:general secretion pathway protein D
MRKTLLAATLLPVLALAQTPAPPPPSRSPGARNQTTTTPPARPARPAPVPGAAPGAPVPPGGQPSAEPPGATATPAPGAPPPGAPPAPGAPPGPAGPPAEPGDGTATIARGATCQPMQGRFLLAFNKADVVDILEQASRWTCRNFAFTEDIARGKITLLSKTPVTAEEAYAAFLAALTANNIAVYQTGRYWKLVRMADAKKTPIPTYFDDGTEVPAQEQPVTKILRLRFADPDQLRGILGNFTSPQGADIQSIPPDVLVITDIGLNVRRLERLIDAVDRPGSGDLVRFIQVRYASARDLAEKVNQIFQAPASQAGRPGARRQQIGGVAPAGQPAAAAPAGGGGPEDLSITKVLADERTNKLVVIADERGYERIADLVAQLDLPTAGEGQIHVLFMKNANADDLAQTLSALAQGQSTTRRPGAPAQVPGMPQQPITAAAAAAGATSAALFAGEVKVTADKQSNALIILASGPDFATMQRIIEKLDTPRRQVFVEAVIMEVNLRNENQFGVSAHTAIPFNTSDGTGFIPLGFQTGRVSSFDVSSLISLGGFLTGLVGPVSADLKDVFPVSSLSVLVQALQTSSDVNILSTPHLLASDNEESEITVGQNVPFQAGYTPSLSGVQTALGGTTATGANATSLANLVGLGGGFSSLIAPIQRQNVELRLRIKPQINEGDMVRMELDEQTEEIVERDATLGPTTAKRSVKTKIVAKDQHTIVIGGLIQDRTVQSVRKIPFLGDIPVLGWLFRDQVTNRQKTNLLLFLTPYIIRDPSDYRRILERKRREQQEFMEQFSGQRIDYAVHIDYARKAGPFSRIRREIDAEAQRLENGGPGAPGERTIGPGVGGERPRRPAVPAPEPGTEPALPAEPETEPPPGFIPPSPAPGEAVPEGAPAPPATPPAAPAPGGPPAGPAPGGPPAGPVPGGPPQPPQ